MLARPPAILRAMRDAVRTVAVLRSAPSTRRDLLLEILALHHQLGVLGRSDRRFRLSDRLFWHVLWWPRWREALVRCASNAWALANSLPPLQSPFVRSCTTPAQLHTSTPRRFSSGRHPPRSWVVQPATGVSGPRFLNSRDSFSTGQRSAVETHARDAYARSLVLHIGGRPTPPSPRALSASLSVTTLGYW